MHKWYNKERPSSNFTLVLGPLPIFLVKPAYGSDFFSEKIPCQERPKSYSQRKMLNIIDFLKKKIS